jgi:hypothetical protein
MQGILKSITYVSRARPGLTDSDVFGIYQAAMKANALDGVTGLLVYDGATFVQIVEGGESALEALFKRLRLDERHCDLIIVDDREIGQRNFGGWSMELLRIDRAHLVGVETAEKLMGPGVDPQIRAMLLGTINDMERIAGNP